LLRLWRTHLRCKKKPTTGCKKRARPKNFFALGARRFRKALAMRILRRKKNFHKPLAFAQAFATLVVVSSNNQPTTI
jgi:hypothetical protein